MTAKAIDNAPASTRSNAHAIRGVLRILEEIETFGETDTGRLCFGRYGEVLVEARRVCWAVSSTMRRRLTDDLRQQRSPPLTRAQLESVFHVCRSQGTPFGEALVSSGLVSEAGLRVALLRHTSEAIARIGESGAAQTDFVNHAAAPYDSRFSFTTAEILAGIGARHDVLSAAVARSTLASAAFSGQDAFAFVSSTESAAPVVVAVNKCVNHRVSSVVDAAELAFGHRTNLGAGGSTVIDDSNGGSIEVSEEGDIFYVRFSEKQYGRRTPPRRPGVRSVASHAGGGQDDYS